MARIFLIRHGETQANSELRYQGQIDTPLNKTGLAQAEYICEKLKDISFAKIFSSDLKRALATAECIAAAHKLSPKKIPELRERNFGAWEDLTFQEIQEKYSELYQKWLKTPEVKIPKAEAFKDFQARVLKGLEIILKEINPEDTVAIFAHGGTNRIILNHFLGTSSAKNFWKIKQDNACINIIETTPSYQIISLINYHQNNLKQASIKY